VWRVWFICWNLALIGSWLSHILIFVLNSLKWDKSLSVCVLFNSFCSLVFLCSLVELWNQPCVNLIFRYNLENTLSCHTFLCSLVYLVFWSKLYILCLLKVLCMHTYQYIYHMACFTFFNPLYMVNSIKS
jgi:hypothetical protein